MIAANVGVGKGSDAFQAGKEACEQALDGMPDRKAHALIVFGSIFFDQDRLIAGVSSVSARDSLVIGCSTAGEISSEGFVTDKSVVILALSSDQVKFFGGIGNHILWNSRRAGLDFGKMVAGQSRKPMNSSLVFLDVVSGSGDTALLGVREGIGNGVPIFGGAAGDDLLFRETYQYFRDKAYTGSIVGTGILGAHHAVCVAMHGFLPIGRARLVTKTNGRCLHSLDGKPALSMYEEYFGEEHTADLYRESLPILAASYPLGIYSSANDAVLLRNTIAVEKNGAMTFTSPIPFGSETRLMTSDTTRELETAALVASEVAKRLEGRKPKAIVVIDSVTRKRMIGQRADEEVETIQRILGRDVPIAGFYGYAELTAENTGDAVFHNGSILIWALAE